MLAKTVLSLGLWLQFAVGQNTPERGPQPSVANSEGDLLFLLDSSGSVSYYEFSKVKEFMWDLVQPFTFGPKGVQASIIHISTVPTMEFPFDRHPSGAALRQAIRDTRQLMGDTNTGSALSYARDKLFSNQAGARPDVPKVLVWVTDGFSSDDISEPMQLLKDMGVTVFIVSTGRGNYLQLSAAASPPPDKHLHFVDVDDLPIITKELRDAILDVIQANQLHAVDITSSSFHLTWPKLLSQETGYYTLEYAPTDDLARKRTMQVSGAHTSLMLSNLAPETTYEVALIPESNVHYFAPQTTRVTTLAEEISPTQVLISESAPRSFHVSWAPTLDSVIGYQILYGPLPGNSVKLLEVDGKHNSTVVENLAPNTTYLVTVTAIYRSGKEKSLSAKACTLEGLQSEAPSL
ncbi:von Willebrand factor A domain-containing protein 1 isoform X3 [Colius striatus]|uniref:von Willebrand factor A domain-containing protein 1 isoform X3 n=1 Tax=Colius striatus TaxID=57412 RepID=UPI002B1E69D7|nr:von Willebrand factor A domain-containing protein 1 isoform X3 [Colius striatus]